ncbi:MAG: Ldh family oxidoreductase [Acidobacteriota bacterium]|nr:Ldh family oxidoreductase [Acidobacteriota bacterium]
MITINRQMLAPTRYCRSRLRTFTAKAFEYCGVVPSDAIQAADVLCTSDEWGIRSHGVARLRSYCEMLLTGNIDARAQPLTTKRFGSIALVDGNNGLGLIAAPFANQLAMAMAGETGIGWVSVRNSNHYGIAGYYTAQAAMKGLIGLSMTNTPPLVSPFGGAERKLGTNPLSLAFPTLSGPPVLIDMATSAISLGFVENAKREGRMVPSLCLANSLGNSSTNPRDLEGGSLLPLGGIVGHKGYCLASMVDLLCGVFPGASWGPFVPTFLNEIHTPERKVGQGIGHLFLCIKAGVFEDLSVVSERAQDWAETMRKTTPAVPAEAVLTPGDPEHMAAKDSNENGVALDSLVYDDLQRLANELDLAF